MCIHSQENSTHDIAELLEYVNSPEIAHGDTGLLVSRIDHAVSNIKVNPVVKRKFMSFYERLAIECEEERGQGLAQGMEQERECSIKSLMAFLESPEKKLKSCWVLLTA